MTTTLAEVPVSANVSPLARGLAGLFPLLKGGQGLTCNGVTWEEYLWLDEQRDEMSSRANFFYQDGKLQVMAPSFYHDRVSRRICLAVVAFSGHFKKPVLAGGSTTFRQQTLQRGLEADECFWIDHIDLVRGVADLDLTIHPAPDLAIEVDRWHDTTEKDGSYAQLQVLELWRFTEENVVFHHRGDDGQYRVEPTSRAFPAVTSQEFSQFLLEHLNDDEAQFLMNCFDWCRSLDNN
jgi:Uma2 family endonuclease